MNQLNRWVLASATLLAALFPFSSAFADNSADATARLNDGQIAKIVRTANEGEIKQGEMAEKRSSNPSVRDFAKMMIDQHHRVNQDLAQVTKSEKIQPADSNNAIALNRDASDTGKRLGELQGKEFDRAYMEAQIKAHQNVLKSIDTELLPNARDKRLQAMLKRVRPEVQSHLEHAKSVQASLSGSAGPTTG